jgi:hypothetical protein
MTIASPQPPPPPPPTPPGPPYATATPPASQQAVGALVVGIIGLVCCHFAAPVAWILGHNEGRAIREGRSSIGGEVYAKIGMILGIIGSIFLAIGLLWLFFGGMAVLSSFISEATRH